MYSTWTISSLIHDCHVLIKAFSDLRCNHVKCCANFVANLLAKYGASTSSYQIWSFTSPAWFGDDLNFDVAAVEQPLSS